MVPKLFLQNSLPLQLPKISAINIVFRPDHFPRHQMRSSYFLPDYIDLIFVDTKVVFLFIVPGYAGVHLEHCPLGPTDRKVNFEG